MKTKVRISIILILVLSSMMVLTPAGAEEAVSLPVEWMGELDGAAYKIRVPENWNGTLLVYAHHYDRVGFDEPRAAAFGTPFEDYLLSLGYGLAGSAFQDGGAGWAVKEGIQDTVALTSFFRDNVAQPERTIIYGVSMGTVITSRIIEENAGLFDGAIKFCGVEAGTTEFWDYLLDIGLAYDVAFGWPESWGEVGDVRDDLNFWSDVYPIYIDQVMNPANIGHFEFIRLVNDMPAEDFWSTDWYGFWFALSGATDNRAELEVRAGGPVAQNVDHVYSLTPDEIAYLAGLGVDAEGLLVEMNARTNISASIPARNYLEHYSDYDGKIKKPVLNIHTIYDSITPVSGQQAYRETIEAAGKEDMLVQMYTDGIGHCRFGAAHLLTGFMAMENWIETGTPPGPELFPESLGFVHDFEPPPWPQP